MSDFDPTTTTLQGLKAARERPGWKPDPACSFAPETWAAEWPGIDGPVIVCNAHGMPAPCEAPDGTDPYSPAPESAPVAAPAGGEERA